MKNKAYFIVLLLFASLAASAQDTLTALPSCTVDDWPHDYHLYFEGDFEFAIGRTMQYAKKYTAKGTDIYGIAAIAYVFEENWRPYIDSHPGASFSQARVHDTTYNECYEWFRLSKRHIDTNDHPDYPYIGETFDTLEILASGKMHMLDTNVIGYFDKSPYGYLTGQTERYLPIRAVFFDSAITVNDDFWVGTTVYSSWPYVDSDSVTHWDSTYTWKLLLPYIENRLSRSRGLDSVWYHSDTVFTEHFGGRSMVHRSYVFFPCYLAIFPLFCEMPVYPSPLLLDSSAASADVAPVLSADDFVTLSPNPAVTEVSVLSSTGMGRLMVYDISGRKVYEATGDGPQATIPIASWPAGIYTVHVETPLGLAVKKLEKVK